MQKSYNLYYNLGYWFLLLIVLVFAGFYSTYFSTFFKPQSPIIHIHFVLMIFWIGMLITQPFLIKYKKRSLHRLLGKISYVLVPLVLLSAFLMIRLSYYHFIDTLNHQNSQGLAKFSKAEILQQAADYEATAFFYFLWFLIFYSLAVFNRRKSPVHARYMLATALTLLGPTVDRIMFFVFKLQILPGSISVMCVAFLLADIILALALWMDYRSRRPTKTLWTCLIIYLTGQVLHFAVQGTNWWQEFISFLMQTKA